jgi:hypothetical protein
MLNLIQHLTKSNAHETLKRVQGNKSQTFCETIKYLTIGDYLDIEKKEMKTFVPVQHFNH